MFTRPYPERLGSIGFWMSVWEFLALMSVITNGLLIYFLSDNIQMIEFKRKLNQLWACLIIEHLIILFKFILKALLKDQPK